MSEVYKTMSKVLANYLGKVVGRIITKPQNAFVWKRQILDLVLIVNECIDSWLKSDQVGILCNLDMEKGYFTSIENSHLFRRCGFGVK